MAVGRVDGAEPPVRAFWRGLDSLRRERGLSYRQLERRAKIAGSTLQYWMTRSERLVPWLQVRAVVRALEAPEQAWFDRWKQADRELAFNGRSGAVRGTGESARKNGTEPINGGQLVGTAVAARAQLPMDIREFTGRELELRQLFEALSPDDDGTAVAVSVITGMAGVGKTRLAVHVAHQLRRSFQFNDVQLYVDLRGHCPGETPADPAATLEAFLRLLGVPGGDVPREMEARAALYRDRLDGKRAIVLLDNAANEQQVRPLLPGSPTCRVLVTSRRKLVGLDGVQPLTLGLFTPEEAVTQLAKVIGCNRVVAERDAAEEIVRRSGYLPLAVALAARRLQARPAWTLTDLADLLSVEAGRLDELAVSDRAVRAVFDLSYGQITDEQRQMFRLLGLHPGHDFTPHSAAALTDTRPENAKVLLETLLDEHLLDQTTCGRYRFHDLLHSYARERADEEETAESRTEAVRRLLAWYLHSTDSAAKTVAPRSRHFPLDSTSEPRWRTVVFDTHEQALNWYEAEHVNLAAAVQAASVHRLDYVAWRLASTLLVFFILRKHWDEWIATYTTAVAAAHRLDDRVGEARTRDGLAIAYCEVHRFPESLDCFQQALMLYRQAGDRLGEALVLNNLGECYRYLDRFEEAIDHYQRSLALFRELGIEDLIGINNLGKAYRAVNRIQEGLDCHRRALTLCQDAADHYNRAEILNDLGEAYSSLGQFEQAVDYFQQTLTLRRALGDRYGEAETLHNLGQAFQSHGQWGDAADCFQQAAAIRRELGDKWGLAQTLDKLAQA